MRETQCGTQDVGSEVLNLISCISHHVSRISYLASFLLSLLLSAPSFAHESRPAYLEIKETAPGQSRVLWRTPVLAGMRLPLVLKMPDGVKNLKAARRTRAGGFTRRTALDRRRAKWASREAHRVRRTSIDNHRRACPPRDAGRQEMDHHRPPVAAVGRDCRLANLVGGDGHLHRGGHPPHPFRRRPPALRAGAFIDCEGSLDAGEDGDRLHGRAQHHARHRDARICAKRPRCRSMPRSP